jgi:hypothetical protein
VQRRIDLVENGQHKVVIETILSLLAIAASEASVEPCLSPHKRMLGHLRTRMSLALINARLCILCEDERGECVRGNANREITSLE